MFLKRTSPILTSALAGGLDIGDKIPFDTEIVTVKRKRKQAKTRGTCDYKSLVYKPPSHHKNRIPFLEKAGQLVVDAFSNPFDFAIGHIFWHKDKNNQDGSYRKVRSEQRKSMTLKVGRFITHHVNLATMSLGHYVKEINEFQYYDYSYLAKTIGINLSQLKRTMARFIKAGYVSVQQRKKKLVDGSYRSLSPIIRVSLRFFYDLGFDAEQITFHVERAEKKLDKDKNQVTRVHEEKIPQLFTPPRKNSKAALKAFAEIARALNIRFNPDST